MESTQTESHNPHDTSGHAQGPKHVVVSCAHLVSWLELSFGCKEANFWIKSSQKFSPIGVADLQEYTKWFSARKQERETEENREGDPI